VITVTACIGTLVAIRRGWAVRRSVKYRQKGICDYQNGGNKGDQNRTELTKLTTWTSKSSQWTCSSNERLEFSVGENEPS
jgi:hypothetical protein